MFKHAIQKKIGDALDLKRVEVANQLVTNQLVYSVQVIVTSGNTCTHYLLQNKQTFYLQTLCMYQLKVQTIQLLLAQ